MKTSDYVVMLKAGDMMLLDSGDMKTGDDVVS